MISLLGTGSCGLSLQGYEPSNHNLAHGELIEIKRASGKELSASLRIRLQRRSQRVTAMGWMDGSDLLYTPGTRPRAATMRANQND